MLVIDWTRERRRILLPLMVLRPFPATDLTGADAVALLDTGSSISGITRRLAAQLGLAGLGKRPLRSAQGEGQVERYAFRIGLVADEAGLAKPSFPFVFDEVIGIELANAFEFNALLGMDILGQCEFSMTRQGGCRLAFG